MFITVNIKLKFVRNDENYQVKIGKLLSTYVKLDGRFLKLGTFWLNFLKRRGLVGKTFRKNLNPDEEEEQEPENLKPQIGSFGYLLILIAFLQ